ncbi:MAG: hypothetical protein NZ809_03105 [Thermodesulfovibrio sp.]|nr:hypothetical protein [Thermodesulfovibrio sp.]
MLLIIGIILVIAGYTILFKVPSDAPPERLMIQAFMGMGISIAGAIFLMIYIYRRSQ